MTDSLRASPWDMLPRVEEEGGRSSCCLRPASSSVSLLEAVLPLVKPGDSVVDLSPGVGSRLSVSLGIGIALLRPVARFKWLVMADTAGQWHALSGLL